MRDPKEPVVWILPDGVAYVITWEYVMNKIEVPLISIKNSIDSQTRSLTAISNRIQEWIDQQQSN